jgi:uncharacterized protein YgbK (DUF1537 family)
MTLLPTPDSLPAHRDVPAADVQRALVGAHRVVFLDDDPTGTQTVRDLPVLTSWSVDDIAWALAQPTAAFFILTNTRSLTPEAAAHRDREIVQACLTAAEKAGTQLTFASRSDSTLRGHFPLETDVISEVIADRGGTVDGVLLAPAYIDAGRLTINGVHMLRTATGLVPVADSEFARDATFGYRSSRLADWVAEKSGGRIPRDNVIEISLDTIRGESSAVLAARLSSARDGRIVVVDAVTDDDLRAVALAVMAVEQAGSTFVYRIGPSFVRARVGQQAMPPVDDESLAGLVRSGGHGLVVVGSHVGLTSRQLSQLAERRPFVGVELDVEAVLDEKRAGQHVREVAAAAAGALTESLVVVSTTRRLVTGPDHTVSLDISRRVSTALSRAVGQIVATHRPSFVVAKGGITSSDIATEALGIHRAWVRGSVLPGIVSLWEAAAGPAAGLPYVVFPGNVGDDAALADVVDRFEVTA